MIVLRKTYFKGICNGAWVCGDLIKRSDGVYIGNVDNGIYKIDPETLSEFTGMTDYTPASDIPRAERISILNSINVNKDHKIPLKNFEDIWEGHPICENDVLEIINIHDPSIHFFEQVIHTCGSFGVMTKFGDKRTFLTFVDLVDYQYRVVGNRFDEFLLTNS